VPPPPGYDVKKTAGGGGRKSPGGEVTNIAKRAGVGFLLGGPIGAAIGAATASWPKKD
jgi:hypothetical protein